MVLSATYDNCNYRRCSGLALGDANIRRVDEGSSRLVIGWRRHVVFGEVEARVVQLSFYGGMTRQARGVGCGAVQWSPCLNSFKERHVDYPLSASLVCVECVPWLPSALAACRGVHQTWAL